jgi:hypothetical protein
MSLLKGVLDFSDTLRDAGATGEVSVHVERGDGLMLLGLVSGASNAEAEAWSQRGRVAKGGLNSLKIGALVFTWPVEGSRLDAPTSLFSPAPDCVGGAANQNRPALAKDTRFYGFEEDTPALR